MGPPPRPCVAFDVTVCRKCGDRMRVLDVVTDPDDIARIYGRSPIMRALFRQFTAITERGDVWMMTIAAAG